MSQQWDTGYLISLIVVGVIAVIAVTVADGGIVSAIRSRGNSAGLTVAVSAAAVLVIAVLVGAGIAFPWSGQYHRYQPLGGTVQQVGSRLIASGTNGGGSTQKFVLTFKGGLTLGCNDTRCDQVKPGDKVTLMCERDFQFNAPVQGWNCNWAGDRKPDGTDIP